jgi:hypothetical protein
VPSPHGLHLTSRLNYKLPTALFFYALIGPFPAAILLISTIQAFTILKAAVLIILWALSVYSASTWKTTKTAATKLGKVDPSIVSAMSF